MSIFSHPDRDCRHNPLHCFVPPHILEVMSKSKNAKVRDAAIDTIRESSQARERRQMYAMMPALAATASPGGKKHRLIYDMENREDPLPGRLVRSEGEGPVGDAAVDEAYDHSGTTYDFYYDTFQRNSLDGNGMRLISSVHFGTAINNAFFDGEQMLYGDGDGIGFIRFTKALDVVAHELTHGVTGFTSNLIYRGEPGALNESFSDVMSALVLQWAQDQTVDEASWRMGAAIMGPKTKAKGLRTFLPELAYENDPIFGTDPQPKHMDDIYTGSFDRGGVHINSGIPNCAFYYVAMALGGHAWEIAGRLWYDTLLALNETSNFQECADQSYLLATRRGAEVMKAVADGWREVGITVREPAMLRAARGVTFTAAVSGYQRSKTKTAVKAGLRRKNKSRSGRSGAKATR